MLPAYTSTADTAAHPNAEQAMQAVLSGKNWPGLDAGLAALALACRRFGYNQVVTSTRLQAPAAKVGGDGQVNDDHRTVTGEQIRASLYKLVTHLSDRKDWDQGQTLWLARRVERAMPEHDHEWGLHPQLLAMKVPAELVSHFVELAHQRTELVWQGAGWPKSHGLECEAVEESQCEQHSMAG